MIPPRNDSSSERICPDCGATIHVADTASPQRCWLCAYSMTVPVLELPSQAPNAGRYGAFYSGMYALAVGFFALMGLGQFVSVAMSGGDDWIGLVFYLVFVGFVFLLAHLRRDRTVSAEQRPRDRFLKLLGSALITLAVGFLIIVGIIIALFVACLTVVGSGGFH